MRVSLMVDRIIHASSLREIASSARHPPSVDGSHVWLPGCSWTATLYAAELGGSDVYCGWSQHPQMRSHLDEPGGKERIL